MNNKQPTQLTPATDGWVDHFLADPHLSPREVIRKREHWAWTTSAAIGIVAMTLLGAFLGLKPIVWFGCALLVDYAIVIPLLGYVHKFDRLILIHLIFIILISFACILFLGGIVHSMGLIFVGLTCSMSSVLFNNRRWSTWLFLLYGATIALTGILQPYLTPYPGISPGANLLFWVINILWISGTTLLFVLDYIGNRSRFEEAETNRLKELEAARTTLYTNITHEFRTPLTIILGMADQIEAEPERWLTQGLEKIRRNGSSLLQLVNQMLDLSRVEAGAMPVLFIQADIGPHLAYLAESFHALAAQKKITLRTSLPNPSLVMDYDPDKLALIVSNLLANALKFTPDGGEVTLEAQRTTSLRNLPGTGAKEPALAIRVHDTGPGIPPDQLPHVFDRYFQVSGNLPTQGGSGLGLTLAREMAHLLGGDLDVESRAGQGATFTLTLPIRNQAPRTQPAYHPEPSALSFPSPGSPPERPASAPPQPLPVLLIVEDNADVTAYLRSLLEDTYQIESATNGQEGWEKALELIPDIVLSDVMMPVMDGFELLSRLKEDERTSHIPVVLLTAKADVESRMQGLERGADAYLAKPFHKNELIISLHKLIELRKKLHQHYASLPDLPPADDQNQDMRMEDLFMRRVHTALEAHLDDENFDITHLAQDLAMSRAQLYRKFAALTDLSVNKYILTFRLHRAKRLLETTDCTVTETAFEVGFKNVSHFSRLFTAEFGVNPREIRPKPD